MNNSDYSDNLSGCCISIHDFVAKNLPGFKVIGGTLPNGKPLVIKERKDGKKLDEPPSPDL